MYRNSYQRGMLTIFFSVGSKPLNIWETHIKDGYITRFLDQDIKSMVLEIGGTNVSTTYMTCPKGDTLGITMPFLVMIVKNLKKYFTFEVTILDETGTRRRFRVSNFQSTTQILPLCTVMPIGLSDGWNQIQFNLAEFTRRAYKKQFVEVQKLKINANIRLRRIYFTERLVPEDQLPPDYKLYFPLPSKGAKKLEAIDTKKKQNIEAAAVKSAETIGVKKSDDGKVSRTELGITGSKGSMRSVSKVASVPKVASIQSSRDKLQEIAEKRISTTSKASVLSASQTSVTDRTLSKTEIENGKSSIAESDRLPLLEANIDNAETVVADEVIDKSRSDVEPISSTKNIVSQEVSEINEEGKQTITD